MEICNKSDCTGCFACMNICPRDAIFVHTDNLGKTVPGVDENKCVQCGICQKICPVNSEPELKKADCSYAVWSRDEKDKLSSSGGAAAVFSRAVLAEGGSVYGCAVKGGIAKHVCCESVDDLEYLRGSKYVQSSVGLCYRNVKEKLNAGKSVLFFGTPCQIAGLRCYLGNDYEKLVTVDLICHGTPPHKYLEEYIANITNSYTEYSFRGACDWFFTVKNGENIKYKKYRNADLYFTAFLDALTYRDNCYICPYARPERVGDITIGDFWGIDRNTMENKYSGKISLVLTNTEKGKAFFNKCKSEFVCEERTFEEAANPTQGNLLHPSFEHSDRDIFVENYKKYGFLKAVLKTSVKKKVNDYKKRAFVLRIKSKVKRIFLIFIKNT